MPLLPNNIESMVLGADGKVGFGSLFGPVLARAIDQDLEYLATLIPGGAGVTSFNSRTGAVTLLSADVTTALGFTPAVAGSGVTTFNTRSGAVVLLSADVTDALTYTPIATSASLQALSGLTTAPDLLPYFTAIGVGGTTGFTSLGRAVVGLSTLTTNQLIVARGAAAPTVIAPGTSGQFLMSNGAGADPSWAAPSGSGDVLGPATNTDNFVPQWNGPNSKTLKNGRAIGAASSTDLIDRAAGDTRYQAASANLNLYAAITPSANVQTFLGAADYPAMRTQLALVIGTNVQAYSANLTTFAGIAPSANVISFLGAANYAAMQALLPAMVGDSGAGGTKGSVPAPAAGDAAAAKFLKADGTWAVPAGGGGGGTWTQIGSTVVPVAASSTVTITGISGSYQDLMIMCDGIQANSSANHQIYIQFGPSAGVLGGGPDFADGLITDTQRWYSRFYIPNYNNANGQIIANFIRNGALSNNYIEDFASPLVASGRVPGFIYNITGGLRSFSFTIYNGSGQFANAGTVTVWGK